MSDHTALIGQHFGMLTILGEAPERDDMGQTQWRCRCDCGREVIIPWHCLRYGKFPSCGCTTWNDILQSRKPESLLSSTA